MITEKNLIRNGKYTNLYKVINRILYNDNYCQRKYLSNMFSGWQQLDYVLNNYSECFMNNHEGNYSYFSITPECYDVYVDTMFRYNRTPIRYTDVSDKYKQEEPKDNIHYVHYDMEVESMNFKTAKQILNESGYILEDTDTKNLVGKFWTKRKEGSSLTPEEADTLLNAPDFSEVVNPKYQEFIKATLKRIIDGNYTPKKVIKEDEPFKEYWIMRFYVYYSPLDENDKLTNGKNVVIDIDDKDKLKEFLGDEEYAKLENTLKNAFDQDPDHIAIKKYKGEWIENGLTSYKGKVRDAYNNFYDVLSKYSYKYITAADGSRYCTKIVFDIDFDKHEPDMGAVETRSDSSLRRYGHSH